MTAAPCGKCGTIQTPEQARQDDGRYYCIADDCGLEMVPFRVLWVWFVWI